ncbi:Protein fmp52, mitochondrial [Podila verticillata]|nr:Protein fmp52, mitochondrial [Podila verticillata]
MTIPMNSCLILGGTGGVGKYLVRDALASNSFTKVLTLGRRIVPTDDTYQNQQLLEQKTVDYDNIPGTFPSDLPQVVFCSLATTRAQAGSAEAFKKIDQQYVVDSARYIHEKAPKDPETGLSKVHFLYCSAQNANEKAYFLYPKTKGETERMLGEIGFERVSIFQPAFLKTVEPRDPHNTRMIEKVFGLFFPVMDLISETCLTAGVDRVAQAMRIVGTQEQAETIAMGVTPTKQETIAKTKTQFAVYNNSAIHEVTNKYASKL